MTGPITPGWYPDPHTGGQRYFDGTNWGPPAPPPPTAPPPENKSSKGKIIAAVIGAVLFLALISTCGNDDKKSESESSKFRPTSSASSSPSSVARGSSGDSSKPDASFTTSPGLDGPEVTATFDIGDNLTEGLIKAGARFETIEILEYAKAEYPDASQVTVRGSFPMVDQYGNTSTDVVVDVTYLRSTIYKINFDGIDKDKIWEVADSGYIAPAFRP